MDPSNITPVCTGSQIAFGDNGKPRLVSSGSWSGLRIKAISHYVQTTLVSWKQEGMYNQAKEQLLRFLSYYPNWGSNPQLNEAVAELKKLWMNFVEEQIRSKVERQLPGFQKEWEEGKLKLERSLIYLSLENAVHPCGSEDCGDLPRSTAFSRLNQGPLEHSDYMRVTCLDGTLSLHKECTQAYGIDPKVFAEASVAAARPVEAFLNQWAGQVFVPKSELLNAEALARKCKCRALSDQLVKVYRTVTKWEEAPRARDGGLPRWALQKLKQEFFDLSLDSARFRLISKRDMEWLLVQMYDRTEFEVLNVVGEWLAYVPEEQKGIDLQNLIQWHLLSNDERCKVLDPSFARNFHPHQLKIVGVIEKANKIAPIQLEPRRRQQPSKIQQLTDQGGRLIAHLRTEPVPMKVVLNLLETIGKQHFFTNLDHIDLLRVRGWQAVWNRKIFPQEYETLDATVRSMESAYIEQQIQERLRGHHKRVVERVKILGEQWQKKQEQKGTDHCVVVIPDLFKELYKKRTEEIEIHPFIVPEVPDLGVKIKQCPPKIREELSKLFYGLDIEKDDADLLFFLREWKLIDRYASRLLRDYRPDTAVGALLRCHLYTPKEEPLPRGLNYRMMSTEALSLLSREWMLCWIKSSGNYTSNLWNAAVEFTEVHHYSDEESDTFMQEVYQLISWTKETFFAVFRRNSKNRKFIPEEKYVKIALSYLTEKKRGENDGPK